ncbi:MAG: dTMP kinase [Gammaproteobacteria bacterium]|nr:dTMP kinase [Gammaproteobacteria bacterium]
MKKRQVKGFFITFEGIEGVGKTTQAQKAYELLDARHPGQVVLTREPGGTSSGESIRNIMLKAGNNGIDGMTEMLLVFAARRLHIRDVIEPSLKAGKIVLCDRFTDATFAYQGGGRGVDKKLIAQLQDMVQNTLRPDLTLLLDAPVETGLARIGERSKPDRLEAETTSFFQRVRRSYLDLSQRYPERIRVIDAARGADEIAAEIRTILGENGLC